MLKRHLLSLMVLACLVQVLLVCRAAVPSLDAVRFVHLAQLIDRDGLGVLVEHQERPVFPLWLWTVHWAVQGLWGPFPAAWARSVQLAAAIPMILAVMPIYLLSVRVVGRTAGVLGAILFCLMRETCRLGADGIGDSTHLLLFALAVWALVEYWTRWQAALPAAAGRAGRWLLWGAGVASGAAVLTRLEAVTIPVAFLVATGAFQVQSSRRQPWRRLAGQVGWFAAGFAVIYLGYAAVSKATASYDIKSVSQLMQAEADTSTWRLPDGEPMSFAVKDPTQSIRHRGYAAAAGRFLLELSQTFGLGAGALALLGLWQLRKRPPSTADRFLHILLVAFSLAALHYCAREGYLDSRHLQPWVVVGIGCAGFGVLEAGRLLAQLPPARRAGLSGRLAAATILGAIVAGCVGQLIPPLHASRFGHRMAAQWLAAEADPSGIVFDTRGWTVLYSGRATYLGEESPLAWSDRHLAYVVVEGDELRLASPRSRTLRWLLQTAGQPVATFPNAPQASAATVLVYRWHPERLSLRTVAYGLDPERREERHAGIGTLVCSERR